MDSYLDIQLRPDPDFAPHMLMSALFNKLHRTLFELHAQDIGISFPEHRHGVQARTLGNRLRLHSTAARLAQLMETPWLTGMRDHVQLSAPLTVPAETRHIQVMRKQPNLGGPSRVKRYAKRHGISESEAEALYAQLATRRLTLPFVTLNSRSTGQRFNLLIAHGKPQKTAQSGPFNHYGLSQHATVPWF
ncbi:type I-F CRISPR-associated endoribonuclease Cas6/Csy4 [Terasakiispira papahanaumokuakeensis]|uniref:Type I-F CRISPR-associated endoribonuclease Cas6/Csy4 n=1 Tax=Terasakiispira papahanaumokuakeensis TaxID=197479 RepID=A0A1E2V6T2_9GAMM|nr:type I-F CRISPR-associated endoribonuclease Cas6/Csy4 [Terasakiispira papahanaumokuakeensis]ODC02709.1 type I-F CRISPR-associated endoribonuclease Cas6/Csy4 [Terasakiispira papahanaumokuakeensis]